MDTQVKATVVWNQAPGLLPIASVTFYRETKPNLTPKDGFRYSYIGSKAKDGKQREKMAVEVVQHNPDNFTGVSGHKFLTGLLNDYQDSLTVKVADGEFGIEFANDADKMVADYFDTSRDSSGRKVTKEKIAEYVMGSSIAAVITARALTKNAQMNEDTLARLLTQYSEMFGKMTRFGLDTIYTPVQATLVRQLLDTSEEDGNEIREWMKVKFAKIEEAMKTQAELCDAI